jgi:hypothetical protein
MGEEDAMPLFLIERNFAAELMIDDAAATHVKKPTTRSASNGCIPSSAMTSGRHTAFTKRLMLTPSVWPRSGSACPLMRSSK